MNLFPLFSALALLLLPLPSQAHNQHPLGKTLLDWDQGEQINSVYAMNIDFHGGALMVVWRALGRVETIDNKSCLVGPYFFFDVRDGFIFDSDETVSIEVLVDRRRTDGFNLSYDHIATPTLKRVELSESYTERWETVVVELDRARFANRKYAGSDFSIGALGATHPQNKNVNGEVALCGINVKKDPSRTKKELIAATKKTESLGTLQLNILDETGQPTSARIGLYDANGKSPLPSADAIPLKPHGTEFRQWPLLHKAKQWSSKGSYISYVDTNYAAKLPEGNYDLYVYKGPEYRISHQKLTVKAKRNTEITTQLKRWTNMPQKGWYSGDDHIHIARPDPSSNATTLSFTSAEDIHVSNLLQMGNLGNEYFEQYAFGSPGQYREHHHSLVPGQESPRTSHRGHSIGLNSSKHIAAQKNYFIYDDIAARIHDNGGLWGYAHVALDAFNVHYGLALDVPLGSVDFLEMLQAGYLNTHYFYDFLNMGFKLLPSAGSDYPYIDVPGSERIYVNIDGKFSPQAWFDARSSQRSFISNGPMIEFAINGDAKSIEFNLGSGQSLAIDAAASVNPDLDQIEKMELIMHGEVIASVRANEPSSELHLTTSITPQRSAWLALRAYGKHGSLAHTSATYIYVDGDRRFWNPATAAGLAKKYTSILKGFMQSNPDLNEDWERFDTEHGLLPTWQRAKTALQQRVDRALAEYQHIIAQAKLSDSLHQPVELP